MEDARRRVARATWRAELRDGRAYLRPGDHPAARSARRCPYARSRSSTCAPAGAAHRHGEGKPGHHRPMVLRLRASAVAEQRRRRRRALRAAPRAAAPARVALHVSSVIGVDARRARCAATSSPTSSANAPPLSHLSALQLLVRHRLLHAVHRVRGRRRRSRRSATSSLGSAASKLDSFLFDDGWDDPKTLWGFHAGFPDGFTRVRTAAARVGAAPGVWLSPWGGYGEPKKERLASAQQQGFETNEGGFALSGPKYYARFHETCFRMMREYGVNQFKFDGTGNASSAFPGQRVRQRLRRRDPSDRRRCAPRSRTSSSTSRPAPIRRPSGCATPTRSGAAARTTTSPASAPTASSGSPIATATPTRTSLGEARSTRSTR